MFESIKRRIDSVRRLKESMRGDLHIDPDKLPDFLRTDYYSEEVESALKSAAELLGVEMPRVVYVPYMSDYKVFAMSDILPKVSPEYFVAGIWEENYNTIYLAIYDAAFELRFGSQRIMNEGMLAFTALHELRHAYQKANEEEKYFSGENAVGLKAHLDDDSEIDADAFAIAYYLNNINPNLDSMGEAVQVLCNIDSGKRARRVHEICRLYGWTVLVVVEGYIPEEVKAILSPAELRARGVM